MLQIHLGVQKTDEVVYFQRDYAIINIWGCETLPMPQTNKPLCRYKYVE